jgi:hypothetical protein
LVHFQDSREVLRAFGIAAHPVQVVGSAA